MIEYILLSVIIVILLVIAFMLSIVVGETNNIFMQLQKTNELLRYLLDKD